MAKLHNLGFPRIGTNRELKFALESYWNNETTEAQLHKVADQRRQENLDAHQYLDFVQVGDFSLYDHVLDTSFLFGNIPQRATNKDSNVLSQYFRIARGRSPEDGCGCSINAGEMTKWFDTNYHYIVPEFTRDTEFSLNPATLLAQVKEARGQGFDVKPVILGPLTYLYLGKHLDDGEALSLLDKLLPCYLELFELLARTGVEWIQLDEPALVTELPAEWRIAFKYAYQVLRERRVKLLLTTYFGDLATNRDLVCQLPVDGIHIDAVRGRQDVYSLADALSESQVLSVGIIDGRNVWKTDLNEALSFLAPLAKRKDQNLWIAPSCSLLHCPVDLDSENLLDPEIKSWLAFARQKLAELRVLGKALNEGVESVAAQLAENKAIIEKRALSARTNHAQVQQAVKNIQPSMYSRTSEYPERIQQQQALLSLPLLPTTTIGSFPQTAEVRQARSAFRAGDMEQQTYQARIRDEIKFCIEQQETLGLDVLVHGEAERNDMVEYFGGLLDGICSTRFGWVQSYGSRCVKPPIIYGDVSRPAPMTVEWTRYAQSLTAKPVKGMLTGPVTILNWSFVRDDQPRTETCQQIALAIRQEVIDLEASGSAIIQIDEAALREGLPLKNRDWAEYLDWAIQAFKLSASGVRDNTQIHTHMCYSEFNDIFTAIAKMDADVITIETSRSDMALLDAFDTFAYPNDIGPGVYDIHSPNIPDEEYMIKLIGAASKRIPVNRLWINPDCGLKTRRWSEVTPALGNMVSAARTLREKYSAEVA